MQGRIPALAAAAFEHKWSMINLNSHVAAHVTVIAAAACVFFKKSFRTRRFRSRCGCLVAAPCKESVVVKHAREVEIKGEARLGSATSPRVSSHRQRDPPFGTRSALTFSGPFVFCLNQGRTPSFQNESALSHRPRRAASRYCEFLYHSNHANPSLPAPERRDAAVDA